MPHLTRSASDSLIRVLSPVDSIFSASCSRVRFIGLDKTAPVCSEMCFANVAEFFLVDAKISACPPFFTVFKAKFVAGFFVLFSIFRASPSLNWISSFRSTPSLRVTGRHSVRTWLALSQPAISSTLFMVALSARICVSGLICMSLASTISSVGPRSASFSRCTSSAITSEISSIHLALCRRSESAFSLVVIIMSYRCSHGSLLSKSPVLMPTVTRFPSFFLSVVYFLNSSNFSLAKALSGVRYMTLPFFSKMCLSPQSSAMRVFPDAVGLAKTRFLHSNTPAFMACSCGGYNSVIPERSVTSLSASGIGSSVIFTSDAPSFRFVGKIIREC